MTHEGFNGSAGCDYFTTGVCTCSDFQPPPEHMEPLVCPYWADNQHCYETEVDSGSYDGGGWSKHRPERGKKCACGAEVKPRNGAVTIG
jgi:hypothetical protein